MESMLISPPDYEPTIAGKTRSEILSMTLMQRHRWYKTISPEEKVEAMKIIGVVRRAKISASKMGHPVSKKTRAKISAAQIGRIHSEETKAKIGAGNRGKTLSEETKAKIGAAHTGKNHYLYGKTVSEETRAKMKATANKPEVKAKNRAALTAKWKDPEFRNKLSGANSANWRGGISFESYGIEFNTKLKNQIREHDGHTCQECHLTEEQLGRALDVHHIDYDKKNNSPENLISLCKSCHAQTNFSREDWIEYFRTRVPSFHK